MRVDIGIVNLNPVRDHLFADLPKLLSCCSMDIVGMKNKISLHLHQ